MFGPYHVDRCEAAAQHFKGRFRIVGVELASFSRVYAWEPSGPTQHFSKMILFPGMTSQDIPWPRRFWATLKAFRKCNARYAFIYNYNQYENFFLAAFLRILGVRTFCMFDSKFDDKRRSVWRELAKRPFFWPYWGGLVSGERSRAYLEFLGMPSGRIATGGDTVSVDRVRSMAGAEPAPGGVDHANRHFTIMARLIPEKNLDVALKGYERYRTIAASCGDKPRPLTICGDGPERAKLEAIVANRCIDGVQFRGFLQAEQLAKVLSSTLALVLPSVQETWGLVVNEALAMGIPVLCSDNVGARDMLVRAGVNGYIFAPSEDKGLGYLMSRLAKDRGEWERFALASLELAPKGDVLTFVEAVDVLCTTARASLTGARSAGALEGSPIR
jgi:glycosyltransferase involved in cell wall biosynthesis